MGRPGNLTWEPPIRWRGRGEESLASRRPASDLMVLKMGPVCLIPDAFLHLNTHDKKMPPLAAGAKGRSFESTTAEFRRPDNADRKLRFRRWLGLWLPARRTNHCSPDRQQPGCLPVRWQVPLRRLGSDIDIEPRHRYGRRQISLEWFRSPVGLLQNGLPGRLRGPEHGRHGDRNHRGRC
jgi:hypothetical protein